jgi:hypothetical protein
MGGCVCEKAALPQQALFWIILSKRHYLQPTMFGVHWREKTVPRQFSISIYRSNGTILTPFDVERGQPHTMWWAVVRWAKERQTNAVSNHLVNATILTTFDVERGQPHIMWWAVVRSRHDKRCLNHLVNGTVLTCFDVERRQQHIWQPYAWDDHATINEWIILSMHNYLLSLILIEVSST